jgi:hypothetical protein
MPRENTGDLFIVADRPEVEWKQVKVTEVEPEPPVKA